MAGLRIGNMLIIVGIGAGLLGSTWSHMVLATIEGGTSGSNSSDVMRFKQHKDNPTQTPINPEEAVDHINDAQSALQNGDTEGAQKHLDLAKQALGCNPLDPRGC